jgi:hypothetical protein
MVFETQKSYDEETEVSNRITTNVVVVDDESVTRRLLSPT